MEATVYNIAARDTPLLPWTENIIWIPVFLNDDLWIFLPIQVFDYTKLIKRTIYNTNNIKLFSTLMKRLKVMHWRYRWELSTSDIEKDGKGKGSPIQALPRNFEIRLTSINSITFGRTKINYLMNKNQNLLKRKFRDFIWSLFRMLVIARNQ